MIVKMEISDTSSITALLKELNTKARKHDKEKYGLSPGFTQQQDYVSVVWDWLLAENHKYKEEETK